MWGHQFHIEGMADGEMYDEADDEDESDIGSIHVTEGVETQTVVQGS